MYTILSKNNASPMVCFSEYNDARHDNFNKPPDDKIIHSYPSRCIADNKVELKIQDQFKCVCSQCLSPVVILPVSGHNINK